MCCQTCHFIMSVEYPTYRQESFFIYALCVSLGQCICMCRTLFFSYPSIYALFKYVTAYRKTIYQFHVRIYHVHPCHIYLLVLQNPFSKLSPFYTLHRTCLLFLKLKMVGRSSKFLSFCIHFLLACMTSHMHYSNREIFTYGSPHTGQSSPCQNEKKRAN